LTCVEEDILSGSHGMCCFFVGARQLVRQDGWQASIFGGRNRPSLLMVAHQLASASEVASS